MSTAVERAGYIPVTEANKHNISWASWGETAGVYPEATNLYQPDKWDEEKTKELLRARAAIDLIYISGRNPNVHVASPNLDNNTEKMLAAFHHRENFLPVDAVIVDNPNVKWFLLASSSTAGHPGINQTQKIVKAYGPFHNTGGGDAPTGNIYIIFYEATS